MSHFERRAFLRRLSAAFSTMALASCGGANKDAAAPVAGSAPVASFTAVPGDAAWTFDASASTPQHGIASYAWNFGDGSAGQGAVATHAFASSGSYTVTLTVFDVAGLSKSASKTVAVPLPPAPPPPANERIAASASFADVSAAVALAGRGDTVRVPAGSANWGTNTLNLTQGIQLLGAGRDNTFITGTNRTDVTAIIYIHPDQYARQHADEFRIEGFTFDGSGVNGGSTSCALIQGSTEYGINLVIGWNRFRETNWNSRALSFRGQTRGVIYKNIFDRCNGIIGNFGLDTLSEWGNPYFPFAFGSSDNLYLEDNTIGWSSSYIGSAPGWCETGQGSRIVYRYNRWDFANAEAGSPEAHFRTTIEVIDAHGFQGWGSPDNHSGETGTKVTEIYGNTVVNCLGNRFLVFRGGWGLVFNNLVSGGGLLSIGAQQYGGDPTYGGGCQNEVEGYDWTAFNAMNPGLAVPLPPFGFKTAINNTYTFNNLINGNLKGMGAGAVFGCSIAEGVDFFNDAPMFPPNTSQISKSTAPPSGSSSEGHGHWRASDPTPNVDPEVIQAGQFYKRVNGAWVDYYAPYTYPHPLRRANG